MEELFHDDLSDDMEKLQELKRNHVEMIKKEVNSNSNIG